jgi:hypothetical protein
MDVDGHIVSQNKVSKKACQQVRKCNAAHAVTTHAMSHLLLWCGAEAQVGMKGTCKHTGGRVCSSGQTRLQDKAHITQHTKLHRSPAGCLLL